MLETLLCKKERAAAPFTPFSREVSKSSGNCPAEEVRRSPNWARCFGEIALLQNIPRTHSVCAYSKEDIIDAFPKSVRRSCRSLFGSREYQAGDSKARLPRWNPLCQNWHPQALQRFASLAAIGEATESEKIVIAGHANQLL